jgi:hypothetical protein
VTLKQRIEDVINDIRNFNDSTAMVYGTGPGDICNDSAQSLVDGMAGLSKT